MQRCKESGKDFNFSVFTVSASEKTKKEVLRDHRDVYLYACRVIASVVTPSIPYFGSSAW